jgi:peptidoglycan/LPS O-acetylase OafA/YrhL
MGKEPKGLSKISTFVRSEGIRSPGVSRRTDVQVLRAVAVLAVILFHAGVPLSGGFLGVDVFFVVSGFVIARLLINEFSIEGCIRFRKFFGKRIRRLLPAASVMVASVGIMSLLIYPTFSVFEPPFITGLAGLLFTANVVIDRISWDYFAPVSEWNPFLHLWSLGVEEQFYLVFPFLLVFLARFLNRRIVLGLFFVAVISFGLSWLGSSDYRILLPFGQSFIGFYSPIARMWEFLIGASVALIGVGFSSKVLRSVLRSLGWIGLGLSFVVVQPGTDNRTLQLLLPVLATAIILFVGDFSAEVNPVARRVTSGIAKIGDWSYSLYLWHWPLMVLGTYAFPLIPAVKGFTLFVSVPLALATYYLVENPVRHPPAGYEGARTKVAVGIAAMSTVALLVSASIMVFLIEPHMKISATMKGDLRSPIGAISSDQVRICADYANCIETGPQSAQSITILGDSHSADLFYGFSREFPQSTVRRIGGTESYGNPDSDLHHQLLGDSSVDMVVVGHYFGNRSMSFDWQSFERAIVNFSDSGKSVVVLDDWPNIGIDPHRCAFGLPVSQDFKVCEIDSTEPAEIRGGYLQYLLSIADRVPLVRILPAYSFFCDHTYCHLGGGDEVWFRDSNHLTPEGSLRVVQYWIQGP